MSEAKAKRHLRAIMKSYTGGSVLHLLADLYRDQAKDARQQNDDLAHRQCKTVEATLIVMGAAIDAACPRER